MKNLHIYLLLIFTLLACDNFDDSSKNIVEYSGNSSQFKDSNVDTNRLIIDPIDSLPDTDTSEKKLKLEKYEKISRKKEKSIQEGMPAEELKSYFLSNSHVVHALENCLKNNQSDEDISKCILEANKIVDIELNKRYHRIFSGLADEEFSETQVVDEVRNSLGMWLEFRKQELYFISHYIFVKKGEIQYDLLADRTIEITKFKTPRGNLNPKYTDKEVFEWCTDYSNYGMRKCAKETKKYYDKILNDRYLSIRDQLDEKGKEVFKKTQLAWIQYDKAESRIYNKIQELFQGSIYSTLSMQNGTRIVRQRARELDFYYTFLVEN